MSFHNTFHSLSILLTYPVQGHIELKPTLADI